LIEREHTTLSLVRQCQLLGLSRSGLYYQPMGESAENVQLMHLIDAEYTRHPFFGYRKMTHWLHKAGYAVNKKRDSAPDADDGVSRDCPPTGAL
jgi:putative transposase